MHHPATARRRSAVAGLATGALAAGTVLLSAVAARGAEAVRATGPQDPAAVLVSLAAGAAAVIAARLTLCAAAAAIALAGQAAGRGAPAAVRIAVATSPRSCRPALAGLLAGSIALGVAGPAAAAPGPGAARPAAASTASVGEPGPQLPSAGWPGLPRPGWLPSPPPHRPAAVTSAADLRLVTSAVSRSAADDEIVVRRGDTLWHQAAPALGPGASAAEIGAEWPRWWQANRQAIGPDPDLLMPGTRLTAPSSPTQPTPISEVPR